MKKYCFDTSGISNPLESMPEDIHESMWNGFKTNGIQSGIIAVTAEIYEEMEHIAGSVGECIKKHKADMLLEVGGAEWDWNGYIDHTNRMQATYKNYISEYIGGSTKTVCLNDISIIALAKTLDLPVVSMEAMLAANGAKRRIPNICQSENVPHLRFSEFLRAENLKF
jgi:hypothetical protein